MPRKTAENRDDSPLLDSLLRDLPPPESGNRITYDSEVKGFGVRVTAAGAKAFVLNYRAGGRERRITIGSFPDWKVKDAREEARSLKRRIDRGEDPMADRHTERAAPTVATLADKYVEYATPRLRPRSLAEDQSILKGIILPALGKVRVAEVRRADVVKLYNDVAKRTPVRANRMLSLLRRMMNLAIREFEMREGANPAAAIERHAESKRDRALTVEELARLTAAIAAHRNRQSANVVRLALLTGARRGELLAATWDQFDLAGGTWTKPASTTKQRRLHMVPLNGPARELLAEMRAEADAENARRAKHDIPALTHLFPGRSTNDAQGDIKRSWQSICKAADLHDLHFHDLRHAFASFLASSGHNLPLIGQLLGHSNPQTTARYAHLLLDPQREATERVGAIVAGAGKPTGEVVPLPTGRRA